MFEKLKKFYKNYTTMNKPEWSFMGDIEYFELIKDFEIRNLYIQTIGSFILICLLVCFAKLTFINLVILTLSLTNFYVGMCLRGEYEWLYSKYYIDKNKKEYSARELWLNIGIQSHLFLLSIILLSISWIIGDFKS